MSGDTIRTQLLAHLQPLLPEEWTVLPYQANVSTIDRIVVVLKHNKISKDPDSPMGTVINEFIVTVVSPVSDIKTAEEQLDDAVLELITALDSHLQLNWTEAQKVLVSEKAGYIGWDITLTIHTQKAST